MTLVDRQMKWSLERESNPRPPPYHGGVLPLNYPGVVPGTGFEPVKAYANRFTVCSIWPLWYPGMEPPVGLEPTTYPLQEDCSTAELRWRHLAV